MRVLLKSITTALCASLFLVGCGGGDSQTSTGGGQSPGGTPITLATVGTYLGTMLMSVRFNARGSEAVRFGVAVVISDSGAVSFRGDEIRFQSRLNNNRFAGRYSFTIADSQINCRSTITINGNVSGGSVSGSAGGPVTCTVDGRSVAGNFSGNYSATKRSTSASAATAESTGGFASAVRRAVR